MPNILAHIHTTDEVYPLTKPNLLLGSVLPDFIGMYNELGNEKISKKVFIGDSCNVAWIGINFHQNLDRVYGRSTEFSKATAPFAKNLEFIGLDYRAARLSSHFMVDLMLDGALAKKNVSEDVFEALSEDVINGRTILDSDILTSGFKKYVKGYFRRGYPNYYMDPVVIAKITQARLQQRAIKIDRPNKADYMFSQDQIDEVADVVDLHTERVHTLTTRALQRSIKIIKS